MNRLEITEKMLATRLNNLLARKAKGPLPQREETVLRNLLAKQSVAHRSHRPVTEKAMANFHSAYPVEATIRDHGASAHAPCTR